MSEDVLSPNTIKLFANPDVNLCKKRFFQLARSTVPYATDPDFDVTAFVAEVSC